MEWLNYHHLLYFWTAVRLGSVSRAAEELHLAQATVSAQLRSLERSLGHKLFVRRGRSLSVSDAGQAVFRYAEEIFSLGRELGAAMRGEATYSRQARFAVGISDSLPKLTAYRLLEPALQPAKPFRPYVRIDKAERLLADLSIHHLDVVLTDAPLTHNLNVRAYNHLLGECGVNVFGVRELVEKYRDGFPNSLHGAPMLMQTRNTPLRQTLDQWFESHDLRPQLAGEVEDMAMLQVLGQHGHGLFVAPSVVAAKICKHYEVTTLGELPEVRARFYAISLERRLQHPAVVALSEAARKGLFAAARCV
jgi:LysR family transcriptional activator of nhaA